MVLPREFFHNNSIQVPNQDAFECKLINTKLYPLFKNANLHHEDIIINSTPIINFMVYNGFNKDLDTTTIYRRIIT